MYLIKSLYWLIQNFISQSLLISDHCNCNVFVQIAKCICPNLKMYLSKLQNVFVQIIKCICPNFKMYLSKLQNVFVQIAKCICPNCKMYLSQLLNVFVLAKCIGSNSKMYLSKLYKSNGHCLERVSDGDA